MWQTIRSSDKNNNLKMSASSSDDRFELPENYLKSWLDIIWRFKRLKQWNYSEALKIK